MKQFKPARSTTRIQMTCFKCRTACSPQEGDWHDGDENQVFLCHHCSRPVLTRTTRSILSPRSGAMKAL